LPFFEEHGVKLLRTLTDRGTEYCGNPERHEYELYLAVEDIDHSRTKTKSPQTNGICERFHKTVLNEFYRVAFRKKIYRSIAELQEDLDAWVREYNEARPHQGRWCFGKTPLQTFLDAMADDEGENDRRLMSDIKTRPLSRRRLSDRVLTSTDQGVPARPLCRSHLDRHDAGQSAAPVVLLDGLCPAVRDAPDRAPRHRPRRLHLRHHSSQAAQGRRARAHQRPPHQDRDGVGLPGRPRLDPRRRSARRRRNGPRLAGMTRVAAARPIARHQPIDPRRPPKTHLRAAPLWRHEPLRPAPRTAQKQPYPLRWASVV